MQASDHQTSVRPVGAPDYNLTISADGYDYVVRDEVDALGYDGSGPVAVAVVVEAGTVIGATDTATPAFDTGAFPVGSSILLTVEATATIAGHGGNGGGNGGNLNAGGDPGEAGGPALNAQIPLTIDNFGTIGGGGGGGSGGNDSVSNSDSPSGGGGAGRDPGTGRTGSAPYVGTLTTGGSKYNVDGGVTGDGGDLGQDGEAGHQAGGAAGPAANGNTNITWRTVGTRLGPLNA